MPMKTIACLSQKGGVGKSTICRLVARSYAISGWRVKIADFNTKQLTSVNWASMRMSTGVAPEIAAEAFSSVKVALRQAHQYDLMVFDGRPDSETSGRDIALESDLVVLPVGTSLDDLAPQVKFAHELLAHGVQRKAILFVINQSADSQIETSDARAYIEMANYAVAKTDIPNKTGYRIAQNSGRAINETTFPTLNDRADGAMQEINDKLTELTKTGVAA
ncbi:ParA family protein [Methylobacterium sp. WL103]|uniref:ParA family protein n=1 Tax=Methylobacterium sp. WL103 TaxID=2603891 RepID=UPI0011C9A7D9|nr:ParA family protein [Methylobacterium sp. WL103]TXN08918.1 ParA family protein [Methylobacterium sp. WL103]